ncbi:MAG: GntR family transcriptional regulator [Spirochaetales bacterium]|nr:GntR family transcriptional regulator [Spirochaetales bacterium]
MDTGNNIFIAVSETSLVPLYEQIMFQLIEKITTKELSAGTLLPSIRSLARDLRISVITIKRAYEELEREGYIITHPGKGSVVARGGKEILYSSTRKEIAGLFKKGISEAGKINMKKQQIRELFMEVLGKESKE